VAGTGVIATALKRGQAPENVIATAVASMIQLNAGASRAALQAGVRAATDVTGFGLLGHLHRMLTASQAAACLNASVIPLLPGAAELAAAGFISGGTGPIPSGCAASPPSMRRCRPSSPRSSATSWPVRAVTLTCTRPVRSKYPDTVNR